MGPAVVVALHAAAVSDARDRRGPRPERRSHPGGWPARAPGTTARELIASDRTHPVGPSFAATSSHGVEVRAGHRLPAGAIAWLVAVGALPLLEIAVLSSRFDPSVIAQGEGWLAHLIGASGDLARAAVPLLAAGVLVAAARMSALAPALQSAFSSPGRPWAALGGHVACFGLLVALSNIAFAASQPGAWILAAWLATGLAAAGLWLGALIPGVIQRGRGWLIGGTLVASAGVGVVEI